jgi:hypothetical protein
MRSIFTVKEDVMKKYLGYLAVIVLAVFILSACEGGGGRDLSTPSSRLVGHWRYTELNEEIQSFISEVNPDTGEGNWTMYSPSSGEVVILKYKILSEVPDGKNLKLLLTHLNGSAITPELVIETDGLTAEILDSDELLTYIDEKTEYEPEK